jgi:hypothetical protein
MRWEFIRRLWHGKPKETKEQLLLRALTCKAGFTTSAQILFEDMQDRYDSYADFWEDIGVWERESVVTTFVANSDEYVRLRRKPFQMVLSTETHGQGIHCLICDMTSYNSNDVSHRYCSNCHLFLNGVAVNE